MAAPSGADGEVASPPTVSKLRFGRAARETLRQGIDVVANVVGATLGPRGRNVAFTRTLRAPRITNDGVTIANEINQVNDIFLDLGIQLMKEAATKTNAATEDGTTTATVLAQAIVHRGLYEIASGANPMRMREGLQLAADAASSALRELARPVESRRDIQHVATVAGDDPEMGEMIAELAERVGPEGLLMVDIHRRGVRLEKRFVDGMQVDRGWASPYFVTESSRMEANLENPRVLLTDQDLLAVADLTPILDAVVASGERRLFLAANVIRGEALAFLLQNKLRGNLNVVAIQAPSYGDEMREVLEDMAVLTGATVVAGSLGMRWRDVPLQWLGRCRRVVANKEATVILEGAGHEADIADRLQQLRAQLAELTNAHERTKLERRIARLGGAVGIIMVGGVTEQEMQALKDKAEDAVGSVKAALAEGVVPGGGVSLLRAQTAVHAATEKLAGDVAAGARTLEGALEAPLRRIARNAGVNPSVVVNRVRKADTWTGWDALTYTYGDMYEQGILDPVSIEIAALRAASGVGGMVLTTETIVCQQRPVPVPRSPDSRGLGPGGIY